MNIEIGPGRFNMTFVPPNGTIMAHVLLKWTETSGWDASPSGITHSWWIDPITLPKFIADLTKLNEEYRSWLATEKARYAETEG